MNKFVNKLVKVITIYGEILSKDNETKKWATDEIIQECLDVIEQLDKVKNEIK